ncbi:hypothetical protein LOAG_01514 [Loa loa]|uniref:Uncharacterized protein n=1 Tax=Loa loa TaxID=7209 RepID=A0A1S0U8T6_LOALO|nr:hypothetical protein LOAG_01514 [Loa loa]EFO26979.1 hypothetical protein LOAG_01514 [Loa loa]
MNELNQKRITAYLQKRCEKMKCVDNRNNPGHCSGNNQEERIDERSLAICQYGRKKFDKGLLMTVIDWVSHWRESEVVLANELEVPPGIW